ncbi:Uncharacterised protein [Sphingobacterium thalpophilum]|uniref:Uncharacterized protein n=1 Tax=Sphingobacterium thalpophilum TaxID=259 RepID=A0A4V6KT68_9SPHI|nr:Uncharacterised protein [Sphingobacterium thalpophilum]
MNLDIQLRGEETRKLEHKTDVYNGGHRAS